MSGPFAKTHMRAEIAKRLAELPGPLRQDLDAQIQRRLQELPELGRARQVLAYLPLNDEPSLSMALSEAIASGKRVYMPVTDERWALHYVRWTPADGTHARAYGRWTPSSREEPNADSAVVLVPGRAFDPEGYRLGRGKGCYDRGMQDLARLGPTIGIAYSTQLVSMIPREQHDQRVDIIVTDRETIRVPAVRKGGGQA